MAGDVSMRGGTAPAYDEFEITLLPMGGDTFHAVARYGNSTASGLFVSPVKREEMAAVRAQLTYGMLAKMKGADTAPDVTSEVRGQMSLGGKGRAESRAPTPRRFGVDLYQALFTDTVRSLYEAALTASSQRGGGGLRLRLRFGGSVPSEIAWLMSLPWELLAPDETKKPLVVSTTSPLVRSFDGDDNPVAPFTPPIRVLAIAASPAGHAALDLEKEERNMREAWGMLPSVRFRFARGRLPLVREAFEQHQPHILHFMGHGDLIGDDGVLLFEAADNSADLVDADRLGTLFGDQSQLRLVFLNSCRGAEAGTSATSSPFAGVATRLVREKVPAVIAMQFPVTDATALEFSREFYTRLVKGMPIDAAVSEARKSVYVQLGTGEWATPVLFLRPRDGALFDRVPVDTRGALQELLARQVIKVHEPTSVVPDTPLSNGPFVVFLATTPGSLKDWVDRAVRDMCSRGMTVVTARQLPWEGYHETFATLAAACDLFLHILGPEPGNQIEDSTEYHAVEQFNVGFDGARSQLVIFPQGTPKTSTYPGYHALLERILACPRDPDRLQVIECDKDGLLQHIEGHRALLERSGATQAAAKVYVDVHARDRAAVGPLCEALDARGIGYVITAEAGQTDLTPVEHFQQTVRSVPLMIVAAGAVEGTWVSQRLREGMKAAVDRDPPTRLVVLRLPGNRDCPPMPYYATAYGDESGYSPTVLDLILAGVDA